MPLIVEDGSNVADANSYISRAELIAYAAARGVAIADEDASDVFAVKAFDKIEAECFKGDQTYDDQSTAFPREIRDGLSGELLYASDAIPNGIRKAQFEYAVAAAKGVDLSPTLTHESNVKREKIGPIDTEYFEAERTDAIVPLAEAALRPFLCGQSFGLRTVRV